jgi:hypothetical protein
MQGNLNVSTRGLFIQYVICLNCNHNSQSILSNQQMLIGNFFSDEVFVSLQN